MIFGISSTYYWLAVAVVLGILELSTATLVCIWFVIGALFAFGISFITSNIWIQMVTFSFVSGVCLAFTRPLAKKILGAEPVPTNADMLIGSECFVTEDILPGRKGRVKTGDVSWLAQSEFALEKGRRVKIEKITGATLTVSPVENYVNQ